MSWKDILKRLVDDRKDKRLWEHADNLDTRMEHMMEHLTGKRNRAGQDLENGDINDIEYLMSVANRLRIDLTEPKTLDMFLHNMLKIGYEIGEVGPALLEESVSSGQTRDYSSAIKTTVQMLKRMGKEVTQEAVMEELEMGDFEWKDEYDELIS